MNNVIRDTEKLHTRQLEAAKRRGERELRNVENIHQGVKKELKKTHQSELIDLDRTHQNQVNAQVNKKEQVLNEMQDHLEKTKLMTDRELKGLKEKSQIEKNEIQKTLNHNRERLRSEHELYLSDINERFNESVRRISQDGNSRFEEMKQVTNSNMQSLSQEGNEKIQAQRDKLTKRYQLEGQEFLKQKTAQDVMNKNQRLQTNMRHQQEISKMSESQSHAFKKRDQEYRRGFKEQDIFFEKKYADQYQRHNESMKALETKNKRVIEDLKTTLTQEISKKASLQDDPFYKFESIKPQIVENKDSVEIKVQIPEHAKKDLLLTTNGKEVVLSFNRRFTDANKLSDGSINKVNKVETFTSRIPTNLTLDPKSIKSSFEDGMMTYIVRKA